MDYNILETNIVFKRNKIQRITVLVDCTGGISKPLSDVRAITATTDNITAGYMKISNGVKLTEELLQRVASAGMKTDERDTIFPNWKSNHGA